MRTSFDNEGIATSYSAKKRDKTRNDGVLDKELLVFSFI